MADESEAASAVSDPAPAPLSREEREAQRA
eukprot:COSAG01_NODE_35674_length_528_cov_1.277389_1_plen_29_part_10